jgi:hypothetical protein
MMAENELLLAYRDLVTEDTVEQLLSLTEKRLVQTGEDKKIRKRVFNILVECLQNIVNHGESSDVTPSLLLIGRHGTSFFIITGNRIRNEHVTALTGRIDEINSWEHNNMREIYSGKLHKSEYSAKGGAGLGLIDIYKRSGSKINYELHAIDSEVSFLSFRIDVAE